MEGEPRETEEGAAAAVPGRAPLTKTSERSYPLMSRIIRGLVKVLPPSVDFTKTIALSMPWATKANWRQTT
jgi:hypothetical protein